MFKKKLHIEAENLSPEEASKALMKGSAEAFNILYNEYHAGVYRFCLRMLGDIELAEDAFQETFEKVFEKRKTFNGVNFPAWLFTITRNICYNTLRNRKYYDSFDETYHAQSENTEGDVCVKDQVNKAIDSLPITYKEAILLREYQDCTYQDIAEILDIDISLAKIRVFRARLILKKILQPIAKEIDGL